MRHQHLRVYDPFARAAFNDIVREFLAPVADGETGKSPLSIRADVSETDAAYLIHAEIPGVRKEDIDVKIDGNDVTIAAEVKRSSETREGEKVLRSERYEGAVLRSFAFTGEIDEAASQAKYENGVLELTLAKKAPLAARKLTVQ